MRIELETSAYDHVNKGEKVGIMKFIRFLILGFEFLIEFVLSLSFSGLVRTLPHFQSNIFRGEFDLKC